MEERRKERREENGSGRSGYHKLLLLLMLMLMLTSPCVFAKGSSHDGGEKILPKVFRISRFEEMNFEFSRSLR